MNKSISFIFAITLFYLLPCSAQSDYVGPAPGVLGPEPGIYGDSQILFPASLASGSTIRYRFSSKDKWKAFDRPLYLSAFPGEERSYNLDFILPNEENEIHLKYTIDKQAPEAPVFIEQRRDIASSLTLAIKGNEKVFISINGSSYSEYDSMNPPSFVSMEDRSTIVYASAYAMDDYGNLSKTASARYRLFPDKFNPSFEAPIIAVDTKIQVVDKPENIESRLTDIRGSALLEITCEPGTIPVAAVNSLEPFKLLSAFVELSGTNTCRVAIPFPWGYEEEILVYYGYRKDNILVIAKEPLRIRPVFEEAASITAPNTSSEPRININENIAHVDWPLSPWQIMYALDDKNYEAYNKPLSIQLKESKQNLFFYMTGPDGTKSDVLSVQIPEKLKNEPAYLEGLENGGRYGPFVLLKPPLGQKILYELHEGLETPAQLSAGSKVLDSKGLKIIGRPGEVVNYALRVAIASSQKELTTERLYFFSVDREAPPVPRIKDKLDSYSSDDAVLAFEKSDESIYVSVSDDGSGNFVLYEKPIIIPGSEEGRKVYTVRAYAEDKFGNRSQELKPVKISIDRSSIYVHPKGRAGAIGSPDDPMPKLEDAISAALSSGKRFIKLRGEFFVGKALKISSQLKISGSYDSNWDESIYERAIIKIQTAGNYAIYTENSKLELENLDIIAESDSSQSIINTIKGNISFKNVKISASGGQEKTAVKSIGSDLSLENTYIVMDNMLTGRAIETSNASILIKDSSILCTSKVSMFEAINLNSGSARIFGLRIEAEPGVAASALSAYSSMVNINSSFFFFSGKASSHRLIGVQSSTININSIYIDINMNGFAEVFSASQSSSLNIMHITALASAPKLTFVNSASSNFSLTNSIINAMGTGSILLRTDQALPEAAVIANCLWGFDTFLEGKNYPVSVKNIDGLNKLANAVPVNFLEAPVKTFKVTEKGIKRLSNTSACVDRAAYTIKVPEPDLFGQARKGRPDPADIGAEEL